MLMLTLQIIWCLVAFGITVETKDTVKVVTFNTGLGTSVRKYDQRRDPIIDALKQSDADVICLNELWYAKDMIKFKEDLKEEFPYSFSAIHNDNEILDEKALASPPCNKWTFSSVLFCYFIKGCNNYPDLFQRIECLTVKCKGFEKLSEECTTCILVSLESTNSVQDNCVNPPQPEKSLTGPGLAIFSRMPMSSRVTRNLLPGIRRLIPRGLLSAEVEGLGAIGCTQFTLPLPLVDPFTPPLFPSYVEENLNNTLEALEYFNNKDKFILMGDFGQSPSRSGIDPLLPDNFNTILGKGLAAPYVDNGGEGTFGTINPLSDFKNPGVYILDHVVHKGLTVESTKRMFDSHIGPDLPLSYHYGVSVTFNKE